MKNLKKIAIFLRIVSIRKNPVYESQQKRFNPYNPLSYILLLIILLLIFTKEGINGLKEIDNPFIWIRHSNKNDDDLNDKKPSKFKNILGVCCRKIDWKWVGISYVFLILIFGIYFIVKDDFIALIYGFLSFTILTCIVFLSIFFDVLEKYNNSNNNDDDGK